VLLLTVGRTLCPREGAINPKCGDNSAVYAHQGPADKRKRTYTDESTAARAVVVKCSPSVEIRMRRLVRCAVVVATACSQPAPVPVAVPVAPEPTPVGPLRPRSVPIGAHETLVAGIGVVDPVEPGPIRLDVPAMVGPDRPIDVLVMVDDDIQGPLDVDVELRGAGISEHQVLTLDAPRGQPGPCIRAPISRDLHAPSRTTCPARHGWVLFRTKLAVGDYAIVARAHGMADAVAPVPVAWLGLLATYRFHPDVRIDDHRVVARGFVKSDIGGAPVHPHRAVLVHGGSELVVDVIVNGQAGVIDRDTQELFYSWGKDETLGGVTVRVERSPNSFEVRWLTRSPRTWNTFLVRVTGTALGDRERRVIAAYLARLVPPPWPLRWNPSLGYAPGPLPARCTADAHSCCMEDGRIIAVEGCDPQGNYPVRRLPDGACEQVPCTGRCLPADARIATPSGDVPVSQLRAGDAVWSQDDHAQRVAVLVSRVAEVPVVDHAILEVTLADGRVVRGSARHPVGPELVLGGLTPGDLLDGSVVTAIRSVPYRGSIWDVLPASASRMYWSNGVAIQSTLR
jgi:hypothetical protein